MEASRNLLTHDVGQLDAGTKVGESVDSGRLVMLQPPQHLTYIKYAMAYTISGICFQHVLQDRKWIHQNSNHFYHFVLPTYAIKRPNGKASGQAPKIIVWTQSSESNLHAEKLKFRISQEPFIQSMCKVAWLFIHTICINPVKLKKRSHNINAGKWRPQSGIVILISSS